MQKMKKISKKWDYVNNVVHNNYKTKENEYKASAKAAKNQWYYKYGEQCNWRTVISIHSKR